MLWFPESVPTLLHVRLAVGPESKLMADYVSLIQMNSTRGPHMSLGDILIRVEYKPGTN